MDFKPFDDVAYRVVFINGGVRIRTEEGSLVASLVAPWGTDDLDELVFEPMDNEIIVAWSGRTQVIKIAEGSYVWSITPYSFAVGLNGAIRMPFYRFESSQNIVMFPSATTGAISIIFSAPVLSPLHVGVIFRYAGRQILVTHVFDSLSALATVIETLPFAQRVTVNNGSAFSVGQIVETDTTNAKAEVVAVVGNDVSLVPVELLTIPVVGENLVSPTGSAKISAVTSIGTAGIVQWDEQFISNYRGWPRSVSKDRQRLIMTNFQQKKNAIFWSAAGNNRDGQIGGDADNAILEYISAECQVYHVVGGYDEFAVTDRGIFYVPISVGTPLQPGSVEFRPIFSNEIANIRPLEVTEGLIFIDKSRTGIYAVSATGQTARPYLANEVNRYHRTLFHGVKSIAVSSGTPVFPSRQVYAVNDDGTVVVGQFNPDRDYIGWLPWDGEGEVRSITGTYGSVVCMSVYNFDGVEVGVAEALDYSLLCDCARTFQSSDFSNFLELNSGAPLLLDDGSNITLGGVVTGFFAGKDVELFAGGFYFGVISVPPNGIINGYSDYESLTIGVHFDWSFQPLLTNFEGGQPVGQGEQKRKIEKMMITVRGTQEFQAGNRVFGSYRGGEDMSLPVPKRDDTYKYRETGRSYDPTVLLKSTFPCAFKLIELTTRITV
ncbi:hypothetical protein [Rhizobium laguerreae]|uniref:hypothetical protein n=1 Tax=Rhizobium laguerreae TaxID=1076926 RepID=UPI001FECB90C|nr:hypothetical protein [Rhizobium laguerreae]